jgi:hypothetical protein
LPPEPWASKDLMISGDYNVCPKGIEMLLYELPRNTGGKVQKSVLRESFKRA